MTTIADQQYQVEFDYASCDVCIVSETHHGNFVLRGSHDVQPPPPEIENEILRPFRVPYSATGNFRAEGHPSGGLDRECLEHWLRIFHECVFEAILARFDGSGNFEWDDGEYFFQQGLHNASVLTAVENINKKVQLESRGLIRFEADEVLMIM